MLKAQAVKLTMPHVHEEHMLMHEHPPQFAGIDRPAHRLDLGHVFSPFRAISKLRVR